MTSHRRPFVVHPLLFGLFPILFLYAQNSEIVRLAEVAVPLLVVGGLAIGLTLMCSLAARSITKGGVIATSTIFLCLSFGHFTRAMPEFEYKVVESVIGPSFVTLVATILVLCVIVIKTLKTRRNLDSITRFLNWIGLVLIAMEFMHGGYVLATREGATPVDQVQSAVVESTRYRPDIYYIIVDGYARSDILKGIYDCDNASFITTLRELGFFVADSSFANYPQTTLSLSSSLNMDYVGNLGQFERSSSDLVPLKDMLGENAVTGFLESLGYTSVVFASGFGPTETKADQKISPGWFNREFPSLIMAMTPISTLFGGLQSSLARHRRRILYALDRLPDLSDVRSPKFVFAHIICPHAPFAFDDEGNEVQYSKHWTLVDGVTMIKDSSDAEKYRQRYREQTAFVTRRLEETLTRLVNSSTRERPPVIIVQADHGPASGLKWDDWTVSNLRERFGILNAYYLPGVSDGVLYHEISPVNSFRIVFNQHFGTAFEILPDRHEFSSMQRPFASQFVSKHLGQNTYDHLMRQYGGQEPDSVSLDEVSKLLGEGTEFTENGYRPVTERGLVIRLDSTCFSSGYEISADWNDEYEVHFLLDTTRIAMDRIAPREGQGGRLRVEKPAVPSAAQQRGFDNILIVPLGGDNVYGIGHLILL